MRKTGLPCIVSTSPDGRGLPASPRRRRPKNWIGRPPKKRKRLSVAELEEKYDVVKKQKLEVLDSKPEDKIKSPKKHDMPVIDIIDDANDTKTKRLSLEDFKDGTQFRLNKDKKSQKKRHSLQPVGTQKTLEGWLKLGTFKPREKSPQNPITEDKKVSSLFTKSSKRTPVKRPAIIEYRGEKLEIKSPRVLLKKNIDISGNLRPRSLQLTPSIGSASPGTTGKALLADLDNDFRVTRNMVSSVDRGQSPHSDRKIDSPSGSLRNHRRKSMRATANKHANYVYDTNDMSDDDLTPRSRESLLRSTEKKKVMATFVGTPTSKGLRSSNKKKQPVSNVDCRDFWTLSDNDEPVTPTSFAKSDKFASLNGALDEHCNNTPDSKSKPVKELQKAATPVSSVTKNASLTGSVKGVKYSEKEHSRSSPVLRSASKLNKDLNLISMIKSDTEQIKSETMLSKATRSLTGLYQENFDNEIDKYLSEYTIPGTENGKNGVNPIRTSELATNDTVALTLQLTPKRKTSEEETPPRIKRSTKSFSELKSYKREERDKLNNEDKAQTDLKIRRKTHGGFKTDENDAKIWNTNQEHGSSSSDVKAVSPSRKSGGKRQKSILLSVEKAGESTYEDPVIDELHKVVDFINSDVKLKIETLKQGPRAVSDTTKHALKSHLSKNKAKIKGKKRNGESKLVSSGIKQGEKLTEKLEVFKNFETNTREVRNISTTNIVKEVNGNKFVIESKSKDLLDSPLFELGMSDRSDSAETGIGIKQRAVAKSKKAKTDKTERKSMIEQKIAGKVEQKTMFEQKLASEIEGKSMIESPIFDMARKDQMQSDADKVNVKQKLANKIEQKIASKIEQKSMVELKIASIIEQKSMFEQVLASEIEQKSMIESPVFEVGQNKAKTGKVKSISVSDFLSKDNNVKNVTPERSRYSPGRKNDKKNGISLLNVNDTVDKLIGQNDEIMTNNNTEISVIDDDGSTGIKSNLEDIQLHKESKGESLLKSDSRKTFSQKSKSSPQKIEQLKGNLEILKRETDKLSEFVNNNQTVRNWCENTCPNPQPTLSRKSPRQGATVPDHGSLAWFTSLAASESKHNEAEGNSGTGTLTPLYEYYSSLLASVGETSGDGTAIKDTVLMSDSAISQQVSHMLKLKSPASKEMQALADRIKRSAEKSKDLSDFCSEDPLNSCPVRLSSSPRHVTEFCSLLTNQPENKPDAKRRTSSKVNGVRKEFHLLDNLEASGNDVSSDRLVMSEYYSPKTSAARKDTDLEVDLVPMI